MIKIHFNSKKIQFNSIQNPTQLDQFTLLTN